MHTHTHNQCVTNLRCIEKRITPPGAAVPHRLFVRLARPDAHLVGDDGHLVSSLVPLLQHRRNLAVPELPVVRSITKLLPWFPCRWSCVVWREKGLARNNAHVTCSCCDRSAARFSPKSHSIPRRLDSAEP